MFYIFVIFLASLAITQGTCPNMISRTEWGAAPPKKITPIPHAVDYVIIHHSDTPECVGDKCNERIRNIQNYHFTRGWDDIGYNFLITPDGNIFEGRGWGKVGAHAPNYNSNSVGVCFIGTFTSKNPSEEALNAAKNLISCGLSIGKIKTNYKLKGHRQVRSTTCPGDSLYNIIQTWPNWVA